MPFNISQGTQVFDFSQSHATGSVNGGPAFVDARAGYAGWSGRVYNVPISSLTYSPFIGHYLYFLGLVGEDVTLLTSSIYEFGPNVPVEWGIQYRKSDILVPVPGNMAIWSWTQGQNSCGWTFDLENNGARTRIGFFEPLGSNVYWTATLDDTRPHDYWLWRDKAHNFRLYRDGVLDTTFNDSPNIITQCSGGSDMRFAKAKTGSTAEFYGGLGFAAIFISSGTNYNEVDAHAKQFHEMFLNNAR